MLIAAGTGLADSTTRVVLADPDPELRRAVVASLRPWRIEVVVDPSAPVDVTSAGTRADDRAARFVVWRDGGQLVVFDRDSHQAERRDAKIGAFDPLDAEAAALSIKTMMRLPPPEAETAVAVPAQAAIDGPELRVEAGMGSRYERGLDTNVALRFSIGGMVRPWLDRGWRFGAIGDFGASAAVEQAGFKGTWSNAAVLGFASWSWTAAADWELEPWAAIGGEHSSLEGAERGEARDERTTLPAFRGGFAARRRFGRWSIAAVASVEVVSGSPPTSGSRAPTAEIFEGPPFSVVGALIFSADVAP